jgi:hypothetical protein
VLRPSLKDGNREVRGLLRDRTAVSSIRVGVLRSPLEHQTDSKRFVQSKATTEINAGGEWSVTLEQPLVAGQVVVAEAFTAAGEGADASDGVTVVDPGSWGRARAYFAGGVIFSKSHGDFSQQDLTLAFAIDKGWLQKPDFKLGLEEGELPREARDAIEMISMESDACVKADFNRRRTCEADARSRIREIRRHYGSQGRLAFRQLNTVLDTRLTALPVAVPPEENEGGGGGDGGEAGDVPDNQDQFLASRKGAILQVGVYAPFYGPQTAWVHDGAVNALFVAPLFRAGIQTITGNDDGTPTVNGKGETDDVFHFWGAGFGIGHQKLSGTTSQTPEIVSYLHIVVGKSEAFQFRREPGGPVIDDWRTMIEGRLKIPNTPLQVGMDANLGHGRDDIRFVFGTRFDIGELFGRLNDFSK